jgi:hypothetical protein
MRPGVPHGATVRSIHLEAFVEELGLVQQALFVQFVQLGLGRFEVDLVVLLHGLVETVIEVVDPGESPWQDLSRRFSSSGARPASRFRRGRV